MSTKAFESAWKLLGIDEPANNVYRKDLKRKASLLDEFLYDWVPEQPGAEVASRSGALAKLFEKSEFWLERSQKDVIKLIEAAHTSGTPESSWPRESDVSSGVGHMIRRVVLLEPEWMGADAFPEHDDLQGVIEYVLWDKGQLPLEQLGDEALSWLIHEWLTSSSCKVFNQHDEFITSPRFIKLARRVLEERKPRNVVWERAKDYYGTPDAAQTLDMAKSLDLPWDARIDKIRALFTPLIDELPAVFLERYHGSNEHFYPNVQVMMLTLADMLDTLPTPLEEMVLDAVKRMSRIEFVPLLRAALSPEMSGLQKTLEEAAPRWRENHMLELLDFAQSPEALVETILDEVSQKGGYWSTNGVGARDSLSSIDEEMFCKILLEKWSEEAPESPEGANLLLSVLEHQKYEGAAELVVLALGHKKKAVREYAKKVLLALGEQARPVLEANLEAKKKAVREACAEALAVLEAASQEPELSEEELAERARKIEEVEAVFKGPYNDRKLFFKRVNEDNVLGWVEAIMPLYVERRRGAWLLKETIETQKGKAPNVALWRVYVNALASYSDSMKVYEKKHDMSAIANAMSPSILDDVFVPVLLQGAHTLAPELYGYYFKRTEQPKIDVIIAGLSHSSKPVREAAFEYAARVFKSADPAQLTDWLASLATLIESSQKHTRELAIKLFAGVSEAHLAPHVTALQNRKEKERSADVLDALDAALVAAGQAEQGAAGQETDGDVAEVASWSDAQALLEAQRARKVPSFIDLEALPDLCWAETSAPLSERALKGLLTTLRDEGPDSRDEIARQVRPWLDDTSAHDFSIALKEQWMKQGAKSSHKWAPYQQGIFVNEARLDEFAPHLADWVSAGRHHWAKWYMDILARHGSEKGRSWVVYWMLNAEHRSLHDHAKALVEELAREQGVTTAELCTRANLYISQDAYELAFPTQLFDESTHATLDDGEAIEFVLDSHDQLMIKRASGKLQKSLPKTASSDVKAQFKALGDRVKRLNSNAISYLEECMISARPWTKASFEAFFLHNPIIARFADRLLFLREDGELFHVNEGDVIDVEWEPMSLPDEGTIRIAHVHDIRDRNVDKWLAHMGEGDVVQPFAQLDRAFFVHGEEPEISEVSLATLAHRLAAQGWRNGRAEDAGMIYDASKIWPGRGVRVTLSHNGIYAGSPGMYKEATPVHIESFQDLMGQRLKPQDVDPIAYSETWLALQELTR